MRERYDRTRQITRQAASISSTALRSALSPLGWPHHKTFERNDVDDGYEGHLPDCAARAVDACSRL